MHDSQANGRLRVCFRQIAESLTRGAWISFPCLGNQAGFVLMKLLDLPLQPLVSIVVVTGPLIGSQKGAPSLAAWGQRA